MHQIKLVTDRRNFQLSFLQSKQEIEVGNKLQLPLSIPEIEAINENSKYVEQCYSTGLTAIVYKLKIDGKHYNLKKKRNEILVKNIDGQTSFLNEVQRRKNFETFKLQEPEKFENIVNTIYASLIHGFILSEWVEGEFITDFNQHNLTDIFKTHIEIEKKGLFECDLSLGNLILDVNNKVRFFDFGYMYPYNPLIHFNSDGKELPIFHLCERLESRALMQYLMDLEIENNMPKMIDTYKLTKQTAITFYNNKLDWLINNRADTEVVNWYKGFIKLWEYSLKNTDNLLNVYQLESFRSYVLDVHDDVSGKSCTERTLKKTNKILDKIHNNFDFLKANNGLFWGDEILNRSQLMDKYKNIEQKVIAYQI